jgi:hypothetical protein
MKYRPGEISNCYFSGNVLSTILGLKCVKYFGRKRDRNKIYFLFFGVGLLDKLESWCDVVVSTFKMSNDKMSKIDIFNFSTPSTYLSIYPAASPRSCLVIAE